MVRKDEISQPQLNVTSSFTSLNIDKDEGSYSIGVLVKNDKVQQAYKLDPTKPLQQIVKEVMDIFDVRRDPREKSLLLEVQDSRKYITEDYLVGNRIDKGSTLVLGTSPDRLVNHVLKFLSQKNDSDDFWHQNLSYLLHYSEDVTFNRYFVGRKGIKILFSIDKQVQELHLGKILSILHACVEDQLVEFMDILAITPDFTENLISQIRSDGHSISDGQVVVQKTLNLLERGVQEVPEVAVRCFKLLSDNPYLQSRLSDKEVNIQLATLQLVNTILLTSMEKESIDDQLLNKLRQIIFNSIIKLDRLPREVAIGTFQNVLLRIKYAKDISTKGDSHSEYQKNFVSKILKNVEKESWDAISLLPISSEFQDSTGILPLRCLEFFSRGSYREHFLAIVSNNATHHQGMFPIAPAAKEVCKIIASELGLKGAKAEITSEFHGLVFGVASDTFEEIFSCTLIAFWQAWVDAKAVQSDFRKVLTVVKEQVRRCLITNVDTLQKYKKNLLQNNYNVIVEEQQIFDTDKDLENHESVAQVKEHLRLEVTKVIIENRLRHMEKATSFCDVTQKKSNIIIKLDKSRRHLCIDSSGKLEGSFGEENQFVKSVQLRNVKKVTEGLDCKALADRGGKRRKEEKNYRLIFAFEHKVAESGETQTMALSADSITTRNIWVDGLNSLLSENDFVPSEFFLNDVDQLLQQKLKLQLIEFQEITIPQQLKSIEDLQPPPPDWITA